MLFFLIYTENTTVLNTLGEIENHNLSYIGPKPQYNDYIWVRKIIFLSQFCYPVVMNCKSLWKESKIPIQPLYGNF